MSQTFSSLFHNAKNQLTRLGLLLFYCYMALAFLGIIGVLLGFTTLLQKILIPSTALNTSWWEIIALIAASGFITKIFFHQSLLLTNLRKEKTIEEVEDYEVTPIPKDSNVIPFKQKSQSMWN